MNKKEIKDAYHLISRLEFLEKEDYTYPYKHERYAINHAMAASEAGFITLKLEQMGVEL